MKLLNCDLDFSTIFTCNLTSELAKEKYQDEKRCYTVAYVRVFDANGLEWTRCVEVDVETGEIIQLKTDVDGLFVENEAGDALVWERVKTAAPLTIRP